MTNPPYVSDVERIRDALNFVLPDDRETWLHMGMAAKSALGDAGFDAWNEWSQGSDAYSERDACDVWKSIKPNGGVTAGTLFHAARANGWQDSGERSQPSPEELAKRQRVAAEKAAQAQAETDHRHAQAAKKALAIWKAARTAPADHPYLAHKGVNREAADLEALLEIDAPQAEEVLGYRPKNGDVALEGRLLVVPVRIGGKLATLEFIDGDGRKTALAGGKKASGFWSAQAAIEGDTLLLGEGVATVLSAKQATGHPAFAALASGNLEAVARELRERHPQAQIVVLADLVKATGEPDPHAVQAAAAVEGLVAAPDFGPDRPEGATDFNDLAQARGLEAVRAAVEAADIARVPSNSEGTAGTRGTASNGAACAVPSGQNAERTGGTAPVPRPGFSVQDERTRFGKPGLYYHSNKGNETQDAFDQWICGPLHADAIAHGERDSDFGLLLRFKNAVGRWREWSMPMRLLKGYGEELRGELLDLGVRIDPAGHRLLNKYLMSCYPKRRILAATITGWHSEGKLFVLPDRTIGEGEVRFQSEHAQHDAYATGGAAEGWRNTIAARCPGNPLLVFSVSAALAGALLAKVHRAGCGFHYLDDSSTGKSTLLIVAASVWGGEGFVRTWRATANGLEGIAAALNDTALILDEIGEADPREIGAVVYAVGNGVGKSRAVRTGGAKAVQRWRVILLSSGEKTLAAILEENGRLAKAGHEARLLTIPSARTFGAFDALHGFTNGRAFSDALRTDAAKHYGHAGPAFVAKMIDDPRDWGDLHARIAALPEFQAADSFDGRAASAFALVALAGELAAEWGVAPWPEEEAMKAAATAFAAWRGHRPHGHTETRQILQAVADFIAKHGDSRFSALGEEDARQPVVRDRAGWWKSALDERVFLFTPGGLRESVPGFDFRRVLAALDASGWLAEKDEGRRSKKVKVQGRALSLYAIAPREAQE